jgi:hypothetical protein
MEDPKKIYEWTALIGGGTGDGSGAFIPFPWDLKTSFGKGNLVPAWMEFDGEPYRGIIANMGSGPCIVLVKAIRQKIGKNGGDTVAIRLWLDTEPRIVEAPDDLKASFETNPLATEAWEKFSPSRRKEYVQWIESAKRAETRTDRVTKATALIAEGKKLK